MIKDLVGKKASQVIESSKYSSTKIGQTAATYLDSQKREAKTAADFAIVTDEMRYSYFRRRIILIALIVNLGSWLLVCMLTQVVSALALGLGLIFAKGGLLLLVPAFSATMMGIYALFRILYPHLEADSEDDGTVMQSFNRSEDSLRVWRVWVVSCGVAAVNSIALAATYMYLSGDWQQYAK